MCTHVQHEAYASARSMSYAARVQPVLRRNLCRTSEVASRAAMSSIRGQQRLIDLRLHASCFVIVLNFHRSVQLAVERSKLR
jgi:hypothetical protein